MNLVQIQERLKDLPTQAIMGYANGQNPQVPPYLALGELNRRKQMEQQAAQPPKGTVKDSIEQQVGLMQLQKLRQGQMAQQSAMQGAQAPMIPQGTPEPAMQPEAEMAMASGGVTSLPVQDMHFGSGGIIAFANPEGKQDVKDEAARELQEAQDRLSSFSNKTYKNLAERQQDTAAIEAAKSDVAKAESKIAGALNAGMDTSPVGVMGRNMGVASLPLPAPSTSGSGSVSEAQATALAGPQAAVPPRVIQPAPAPAQTMRVKPPAPPAPPVAPVLTDAQKFQSGILAGRGMTELPPEYAPPKQAPIGEDYLKYVTDREQKRREDALKFEDVQKARDKRDFFNSLIAGGESTRGQKGIGSLFGGTGRALGEAATAAEERRMAFDKAQQELADNDAKTRFEINNLRRAEERGDTKAIYDSKVKIAELGHQKDQLQGQVANQMSSNESQERIAKANNLTHLEVARINQATAMKPGETERLMAQYGALKAKDPKAAEEFMANLERIKTGSRGETAQQRLNVQRQALAEKLPAYQMAMSTYVNEKDPAKKAAALTKIRELESLHGIKSDEAPTIDTSQWGNPKVK
jgi:hypothetical protein